MIGVSIDADELDGLQAAAAERGLGSGQLADVGDADPTRLAGTCTTFGAIDVVVNNAGTIMVKPIAADLGRRFRSRACDQPAWSVYVLPSVPGANGRARQRHDHQRQLAVLV